MCPLINLLWPKIKKTFDESAVFCANPSDIMAEKNEVAEYLIFPKPYGVFPMTYRILLWRYVIFPKQE